MRELALAALAALAVPLSALAAGEAQATLKDATGKEVGTATFAPADGGVRMTVKVKGLPPGAHGIHVHAVGRCDPPDFKSAGAHLNPTGKKHGLQSPEGHHAGDLPNLEVKPDGTGELAATLDGASLQGGAGSLLGPEGTAVVVHAAPDDERTDPAGSSGARIACGAIGKK